MKSIKEIVYFSAESEKMISWAGSPADRPKQGESFGYEGKRLQN
jgi:hypothetical protein